MTIKVGDRVPDAKLSETTEFDSATQCAMAPKEVNVADALKGQEGRDLRPAWRVYTDLLGEARAELPFEPRQADWRKA
jgi:hypothetical protein